MSNKLLEYFSGDDMAANVWPSKYAYKGETMPGQMHSRMAREIARKEKEYQKKEPIRYGAPTIAKASGLSKYGYTRMDLTEAAILNLFKNFKHLIPQGSIMATLGTPVIASLSNCLVIEGAVNSYGGILKTDEEQIQLMKRRGGVGHDLSKLQPANTRINNAAKSSTGAVSFAHRFSNSTREVAQNGRRGALMLTIDIRHPDSLDFVKIKRDLTQVTGANMSVKIDDEFMEAVEKDERFILRFPIDYDLNQVDPGDLYYLKTDQLYDTERDICSTLEPGFLKAVDAKKLWEEVIKSAHNVAEPGILFWDRITEYSPDSVYEQYKPVCTNPCVIPSTTLLTKKGFEPIIDLAGKDVEIWNGIEWTDVRPYKTSDNEDVYKVLFSDGSDLTCTRYHEFILKGGGRKELKDMIVGDKLDKFTYPLIEYDESQYSDRDWYTQGFYSGDGTADKRRGRHFIDLYGSKIGLKKHLNAEKYGTYREAEDKIRTLVGTLVSENKTYVPVAGSTKARLAWLAGIIDSDGTLNDIGGSVAVTSVEREFLMDIKKMLIGLGIRSTVGLNREARTTDIKGTDYECKACYRLVIAAWSVRELRELGLDTKRVPISANPNRNAARYIQVKSIELVGQSDVYCVTDNKNHSALFNDVMTAQCGEIPLQPYDACRLFVNNLYHYVVNPFTKNSYFDFKKFYEYNYEALRILDDIVDLEIEHIDRILEKIENDPEDEDTKRTEYNLWIKVKDTALASRRTGLGFTALGDTLAALGIRYGSDEAVAFADELGKVKLRSELDCTIDLAILRGPFEGWDIKKEFSVVDGRFKGNNSFYQMLADEFPEQVARMITHGRRNLSWSTVAPTGSVSILTQTTAGIEPLFKAFYTRRKKINPSDIGARVDFVDDSGDSWQEFQVLHERFKDWLIIAGGFESVEGLTKGQLELLFMQSPWYGATAEEIPWEGRVKMQSTVQKYISHSISSTINLPKDVTEKEVADIYMAAWKQGLKGITVYRDGSRSGVLVSEKNIGFKQTDAPKRSKTLKAEGHTTVIKGAKHNVIVGMMDGKPYEVFMFPFTKELSKGTISKVERGAYDYVDDKDFTLSSLTGMMSDEQEAITRLVSTSLRHGAEIRFVTEQLKKVDGELFSFTKGLSRVLGKYITNGSKSTLTCSECGSENMVYEEGCESCRDCGNSACG